MAALDVDKVKEKALAFAKGFSPSQIIIIGLLGVVSVVAAMSFLRWVTAPTYGVLVSGMDAKDASAVTAELDGSGVPYQLEGGGSTVLVPTDQLDAQRLAIAAAGLPAGATTGGWEAFDATGLTSSSMQQKVAYQRAMQSELSSAVQGIDGVRSATVNLAIPEERLFSDDQQSVRASVLVDTAGTLADGTVDAITHLVSSAIPGLEPQNVSITDSSGSLLTGEGAAATGDRASKARQAMEDQLSARATTMFDTLLGPGKAVVRVSAEMDTANRTIDSETYDPTRVAVLASNGAEETYTTTQDPNATAEGTLSTAGTPAGANGTGTGDYKKSSSSVQNGVSRTVERQVLAPGGIKRLTVAVAVDRNAANAPTPAEVQALVANAVGLDPARGDTIAVTTPSFPVADEAATDGPPAGTTAGSSTTDLATTGLGALLLVLVGIGFLRTVRRGSVTEIPVSEVTAAIESAGGRKGRKGAKGLPGAETPALPAGAVPAPREEPGLLETLDDNPDEVANLLRGWLATTGGDR